jgi:hypothetical protein
MKYIDEFHDEIAQHLYIQDEEALDIVLATAAANFIEGDPVWLLLVGPSGGGKTELLNMFQDSKHALTISKFTKNTLLSGFKNLPTGQDLLFQMKDKLVIIKDLAPILELGKDEQREILADLRDAYDGYVSKRWGTGQTKTWKGKFGLIAASTNALDKKWKLYSELGERFIRVNLKTDAKAQTEFAMRRIGSEELFRDKLRELGCGFLDHYQKSAQTQLPPIPDEVTSQISRLGILTARLRTPVMRNANKDVEVLPIPEVGTRLSKQLMRLAQSSALMFESPEVKLYGDYKLALRVAVDSIPVKRTLILSNLLEGCSTTQEISRNTSLPKTTISYELADMRMLGVITESSSGSGWEILEEIEFELRKTGIVAQLSRKVTPMAA